MKSKSKKLFGVLSVLILISMGYEVAVHEVQMHENPTAQKMHFIDSAYGQNLERGFADLVKKVIPGVVNISTYARPRFQQYGYGSDAQSELFRRFFEEFFGGRVPPPGGRAGPGHNIGPPQDNEDEQPRVAPKSKSVPVALGTGFIIDAGEGLILTNNHVVQGAEEVKIQFREEESDLVPAEIIGRDPELDVALLKVKSKAKLTAIPMGDSDAIDVGEYVLAIGNPLGYGHTVSHGILSAKGRRNPEFRMGRFLQTDASINPGNSGGPLINARGEVVGINNAIDARGQGIGFAIPINLVKSVLSQLKTKGSVTRAFLGVSASDLSPEIAEQLNINPKLKGVIVSDVQPGQSADHAGIKPYDVITAINGEPILNSSDLTLKVSGSTIGKTIKLDLVRAGKPKSIEVKLNARPTEAELAAGAGGRSHSSSFDDYGFKVAEASLGGRKGVSVRDVAPESPAAQSGLSTGDFILDVAGREVHSIAELERALKTAKGNSILVRVKRFDPSGNEFVSVVVLTKQMR